MSDGSEVLQYDPEVRGISDDRELLENYDPDASPNVATECPACGGVIVVFKSGQIGQPRTTPHEPGVMPANLLSMAFEKHHCPEKPGTFACKKCSERYDVAEEADRCCSKWEDNGFVKVKGADKING